MKTELVFKLSREPDGYGQLFAPDCVVNVVNTKGILYLEYNSRHPVGSFENLRCDGENILADIEIFEHFKNIEHRFDYAIGGHVAKQENAEAKMVLVHSVGALMKTKD